MTFFETMIAYDFKNDFYAPGNIATIIPIAIGTLASHSSMFGNLYHQSHKLSFNNLQLQTSNYKL